MSRKEYLSQIIRSGFARIKWEGLTSWLWHRRHLTPEKETLSIHKNNISLPYNIICLKDVCSIERVNLESHCILVRTKGRRYYFAFESDKELYGWQDDVYACSPLGASASNPVNFIHKIHVSFDPLLGVYMGLPEEWHKLFTHIPTMLEGDFKDQQVIHDVPEIYPNYEEGIALHQSSTTSSSLLRPLSSTLSSSILRTDPPTRLVSLSRFDGVSDKLESTPTSDAKRVDRTDTVVPYLDISNEMPIACILCDLSDLLSRDDSSPFLTSGANVDRAPITTEAGPTPVSFEAILHTLLLSSLANIYNSGPHEIIKKLKGIGCATWMIFKQVLVVVRDGSASFPPLQAALGSLCATLDQCNTIDDGKDGLFETSSKLAGLQYILARFSESDDERNKGRLEGLANWVESVTTYINAEVVQNGAKRFFNDVEDCTSARNILQSFATVIDLLMLDVTRNPIHDVRQPEIKADNLADYTDLKELHQVTEASWSAQEEGCLSGTRCAVMADIMKWCADPNESRVFWLSGMAGTGKSAIARTLCDYLNRAGLLSGSFFCSGCGSDGQRDVKRIITTLASQLTRSDAQYRQNIIECLRVDSNIAGAMIDTQLEKLLIKPCFNSFRSVPAPLILVIDGLDEGSEADDIAQLLEKILQKAPKIPFRFFVTRRPESHIQEKLLQRIHPNRKTILYLHDIEQSSVKADIRFYVKHHLDKIKERFIRHLPEEWPREDQVEDLIDRADRLFIYAHTACNYIKADPACRLARVVQAAGNNQRSLKPLDDMYTLILDDAKDLNRVGNDVISDVRECLTALVCVRGTLTVSGLAEMLRMRPSRVRFALQDLHSLIIVPSSNDDEPVMMVHASLGDYLIDERRSKHHFVMGSENITWDSDALQVRQLNVQDI